MSIASGLAGSDAPMMLFPRAQAVRDGSAPGSDARIRTDALFPRLRGQQPLPRVQALAALR